MITASAAAAGTRITVAAATITRAWRSFTSKYHDGFPGDGRGTARVQTGQAGQRRRTTAAAQPQLTAVRRHLGGTRP